MSNSASKRTRLRRHDAPATLIFDSNFSATFRQSFVGWESEWVRGHLRNPAWVTEARQQLHGLSWFMKSLKEPLSRLAKREEPTRGAFFEGRFKSVAMILECLGSSADHWQARLEKLRQGRLLGRFFATSRQCLREVAAGLGLRRVPNLGGCATT